MELEFEVSGRSSAEPNVIVPSTREPEANRTGEMSSPGILWFPRVFGAICSGKPALADGLD